MSEDERRQGEDEIRPVKTEIAVFHGRVLIAHSEPVGRQFLTPTQARVIARVLNQCADVAETQPPAGGAARN